MVSFKNKIQILTILLLCFLIFYNFFDFKINNINAQEINSDLSQKKAELEQKIREKSAELEKINQELSKTQSNLEETQKQKASLQNEIKRLNETIKQLELNISSDEKTIQKLSLEIESLGYDIKNINLTIEKKQESIIKTIQQIQKSENKNLLMILLSNDSLADSVGEAKNLIDLKNQLQIDIKNLSDLQKELNNKLNISQNKKDDIEIRKNNLLVRQSIIKDTQQTKQIVLSQTKNQETLYAKQLEELKKQQEQLEDEIYQIEEELRKNFNFSVIPSKNKGLLEWPIKLKEDGGIGIITQHYGNTPYSSRLYKGRPHNGLDIGAPVGTPVYAALDGVVMRTDNNDKSSWAKYQYGKYVIVKHPNNLATLYSHLSRYVVSAGQNVKKGDLIGYSGNTGYSTGPHLHLGLYWAPSIVFKSIPPAAGLVPVGVTLNPEDYL